MSLHSGERVVKEHVVKDFLYHYNAHVIDVYDGDTITVDIDLGLGTWLKKQKIRLYGVNTPEIRGEDRENGLRVRDKVRSIILDKDIVLQTHKDKSGKFGRWLGVVWIDGLCVNDFLLINNMAEEYTP